MRISTHKRLDDYCKACHVWHAFLVFLMLISLCSCDITSNYSATLTRAEHLLESDSARAMAYYCSLPDSITEFVDFNHHHTQLCLANFYFRKAVCALTFNDVGKAEHMFGKYVETSLNIHNDDTHKITLLRKSASVFVELGKVKVAPTDIITRQALISQMKELQLEKDNHYKENFTASSLYSFTRNKFYFPFLIFLSFIIGSLLFYEQQLKQFTLTINKRKEQQQQLKKRITILQTQVTENESEIANLEYLNSKIQEISHQELGQGKIIFDSIEAGGNMKNISIANEKCFVDYYAYTYPNDYRQITSPFSSLTLRHTTYLILSNLGHNDADIQRILFVQPSTIRNYRLRMNRNLKDRHKL